MRDKVAASDLGIRREKEPRIIMNQLVEFLYPAPARRSVGGIVQWWERRRLAYNVLVGGAGLVTTAWVSLLSVTVWGDALHPEMVIPIVVFGVGANLFYTLGSAVEVAAEKLFGGQVLPVGPVLYRMGLTFSVGLALFPALLVTLMAVAYVVGGLFGLV